MQTTKDMLRGYLATPREALLWKLEGLDERDARLPRTPTGTSLLGLVKHAAAIEEGYFGVVFGRKHHGPELYDVADPLSDMYATPDESPAEIATIYLEVQEFANATIDELDLDALGSVPWWPAERRDVTLERIIVHVAIDLARHAGHADILREQIDGTAGLRVGNTNIPSLSADDWAAHHRKLTAIADGERPHV